MYYTGKTQKEFQHTAARRRLDTILKAHDVIFSVSTHSRPKAAGDHQCAQRVAELEFQHTAARRRLAYPTTSNPFSLWFQHTAARRRLVSIVGTSQGRPSVSTHSRPKAAGQQKPAQRQGGEFQHTAARRRLVSWIFSFINQT